MTYCLSTEKPNSARSLTHPFCLVTGDFVVYAPVRQVAFIVHTFMDTSHVDYRYFIWIFFFGMANSMLNPIIYGACLFCCGKKHVQRYVAYNRSI